MLFAHVRQTLEHQLFHDAAPCKLRVGAYGCDKGDRIRCPVNVHFQRISCKLRYEIFTGEASHDIGALQYRELGLLDLIVLPAGLKKLLLRDLECIAKQRILLIQIVRCQIADRKIRIQRRITCILFHTISPS